MKKIILTAFLLGASAVSAETVRLIPGKGNKVVDSVKDVKKKLEKKGYTVVTKKGAEFDYVILVDRGGFGHKELTWPVSTSSVTIFVYSGSPEEVKAKMEAEEPDMQFNGTGKSWGGAAKSAVRQFDDWLGMTGI